MAEIPVERKSGMPWWLWLIAGLLLIGLLFLIFDGDDEGERLQDPAAVVVADPAIPPQNGVDVAPAGTTDGTATADAMAGGPITDLTTILDTQDRSTLVGRSVNLTGVRVLDVVGDRTFYVGSDQSRRAFVVLNEVPTPGQPGVEGRYDVTTGQTININGTMRTPNDAALANQPIEGMPAGTDVFIHAQSLDVVQRP